MSQWCNLAFISGQKGRNKGRTLMGKDRRTFSVELGQNIISQMLFDPVLHYVSIEQQFLPVE